MKVGDLFVNLGIKGDAKAVQATRGVRDTLGEISTKGLAAKAMIFGVVYGLQRLMQNSADAGASLMSYAGATGLSAETLQRWQYAARQANVGAEEMENSITGLQSAMVSMAMGNGVPAGMGVVSNAVGVDQSRIRDTMYMMSKLAEYAKKEGNVDFANEQLKSFGLSLGMISAMRRGAFNQGNLNSAPIYSDKEAAQLQKVDVAWSNLGRKFEMAMGHLNAKHGLSLVKDLSAVSTQFIKMLDLFARLIEKTSALKLVGMVFEGWGLIFKEINEGLAGMNAMAEAQKSNNQAQGGAGEGFFPSWELIKKRNDDLWSGKAFEPKTAAGPPSSMATVNQHINTTNHIHGVKDGKDAGHHVGKSINRAAAQINTKGQTN